MIYLSGQKYKKSGNSTGNKKKTKVFVNCQYQYLSSKALRQSSELKNQLKKGRLRHYSFFIVIYI